MDGCGSSASVRHVPRVWFIGSSLIARLEQHVIATRSRGFSFGVECQIRWFGRGGMRWEDLVPLLQRTYGPVPDVMVIHLGGNNIGFQSGCTLLHWMREDLGWIMSTYPETRLLFSCIVERRVYRGLRAHPYVLERARRLVNSGIAAFLADRGHGRVSHRNIRHNLDLYLSDGVHLNHRGNEVFLQNFHDGLSRVCRRPVNFHQYHG